MIRTILCDPTSNDCTPTIARVCDAGNVGNLPLVLVAALCGGPNSPIAYSVPPGQCAELGIAYVVFAMWVAGLFQFSVGYFLLKPSPEVSSERLSSSSCMMLLSCHGVPCARCIGPRWSALVWAELRNANNFPLGYAPVLPPPSSCLVHR